MDRIHGIDVARSIAIIGMLFVNYKVILGSGTNGPTYLVGTMRSIEGRFASLFVVLAGIGFGLMYRSTKNKSGKEQFTTTVLRRAIFLLVIGLIHKTIWQPDILHFYAFYFLTGLLLIRLPSSVLILVPALSSICFHYLTVTQAVPEPKSFQSTIADYSLTTMYWILWDGYYPLVPWIGFFATGVVLSRIDLKSKNNLLLIGFAGFALLSLAHVIRVWLDHPSYSYYPYPPDFIFLLSNLGSALLVVVLSIVAAIGFPDSKLISSLSSTGRLALTIYLLHAVPMIVLANRLSLWQSTLPFTIAVAAAASISFTVFAVYWNRYFNYGPFEHVMRNFLVFKSSSEKPKTGVQRITTEKIDGHHETHFRNTN